MDEPPRKRTKFSFDSSNKLSESKGRLPDLDKLNPIVKESLAPQAVRDKFCGPARFIGIDIETHALVPKSGSCHWRSDEFGVLSGVSKECVSSLRMVQLGWAFADWGAIVTKTKLIKPVGFTIEDDAADMHRISHEEACDNGVPIQDALREFFKDVTDAAEKGYRICAHHLGFDAGIILRELDRAELHSCKPAWVSLVRKGLCTMDPSIAHWVRQQIGLWDFPRNLPLRLKDAITFMLPNHTDLLSKHHHAGNDAHMHVLLAQELHRRANLCLPEIAPQATSG